MARSGAALSKRIASLEPRLQEEKLDESLKNGIRQALKIVKQYENNGSIDPCLAFLNDKPEHLECAPYTVLGVSERRPVDHLYTIDIETYKLQPDALHFGCLLNVDTRENHIFRSWHNEYAIKKKKANNGREKKERILIQQGIIEHLEDVLFYHAKEAILAEESAARIHVYAHNGAKFDFVGLAYSIMSNYQIDPIVLGFAEDRFNAMMEGISTKDKFEMRPHATPVLKKSLSLGSERKSLLRKRKYDGETHEKLKKLQTFTWEICAAGKNYYIKLKLGRHELRLYDSLWHLPMALSDLGAKGKTPIQYTNPKKWIDTEIAEGRLDLSSVEDPDEIRRLKRAYWKDTLTDEAKQYCIDDCSILADALMTYRRIFGGLFLKPWGEPLDPLAYTTSAQAALAGMILYTQPNRLEDPEKDVKGYAIYHPAFRSWRYESRKEYLEAFIAEHQPQVLSKPFSANSVPAITKHAWWCKRDYAQSWLNVQYGGRTEVFQPMNRPGTRVVGFDRNSMYPSEMQSGDYIDPRRISRLKQPIQGKAAILEHLRKRSGLYLMESSPATNPIIARELPVFPMRLGGEDYDGRLLFPTWKGRLLHYVTGEELKYFLSVTDIENDDIVIHAEKSLTAPLVPRHILPFHHFAGEVFKRRREAQRRGDQMEAKLLKAILNAGGYGTLVQINEKDYEIKNNEESRDFVFSKLVPMSQDWSGWFDHDEEKETTIELVKKWAEAHYRPCSPAKEKVEIGRHDDGSPRYIEIDQVSLSLPSKRADHAIPPWGCAIAAHARVSLHKALLAVREADFGVLYCDTDSVYFEVPKEMTDAEVVERLHSIKKNGRQIVSIGDNLGQWKIEPPIANPELVTPDCDVKEAGGDKVEIIRPQAYFLAPKHYYLTDKKGNVLKDVVKSIPRRETLMRCSMEAYFARFTRLGDPRGINLDNDFSRDLAKKIEEGRGAKRRYRSPTAPSEPIVVKNVTAPEGSTGLMYLAQLSQAHRGLSVGLTEALHHYAHTAKIQGVSYRKVRESVREAMYEITKEARITHGKDMPTNYIIDKMKERGLLATIIDDEDGLPI